ncbi:hydrolase, partial [Streptomyces sp. W16]|nr:hydrolase [Streptomyces sp. W16]
AEGRGDTPRSGAPTAPGRTGGGDVPQPLPTDVPQQDQPQNAPRAAQVACCEDPAPEPEPSPGGDVVQPLVTVVADVVDTITSLVPVLH